MTILPHSNHLVRTCCSEDWQHYLKTAVRTPEELACRLNLPLNCISSPQACGDFPLFVPEPFLKRMVVGDVNDPLLKQVLPMAAESQQTEHFSSDPLSEFQPFLSSGYLKKYRGRALVMVHGTCAVHCRYCFRRHFPYESIPASRNRWQRAISQIQTDLSIREIILSGGDPLTLVDHQLSLLIDQCEAIPHVHQLRIHTRLPVVIPQRITTHLVHRLRRSRLIPVIVIHSNHAREIDDDVQQAIERLRRQLIQVLNQAVLLKGVNDRLQDQVALSRRLIEIGVMPYYLHQLDRVAGAAHFEVPIADGIELVRNMRMELPGYMVPRYVREIPDEPYKSILA